MEEYRSNRFKDSIEKMIERNYHYHHYYYKLNIRKMKAKRIIFEIMNNYNNNVRSVIKTKESVLKVLYKLRPKYIREN